MSDPTVGAGDTAVNKTDTSALVPMPLTINAERLYFSGRRIKNREEAEFGDNGD